MCSLARFWRWEDKIAKSATNESHSYEFDIRAEGRRQNDAEDVGWKCEEERRWRSKRWRQIVCVIVSNLLMRRRRGRSGTVGGHQCARGWELGKQSSQRSAKAKLGD